MVSILSACGTPLTAPSLGRAAPSLGAEDFRADGVSKREIVVGLTGTAGKTIAGMAVKWALSALRAAVVEVPAGKSPEQAVAALARAPGVKYSDVVRQVDVEAPDPPNRFSPGFGFLTDAASASPGGPGTGLLLPTADPREAEQYGLSLIKAAEAWKTTRGNRGTLIGMVDSGIDLTHPDLRAQIAGAYNVVTRGSDVTDSRGHGTHTSGIAAAAGGNGEGGSGVAPGCAILAVQISAQGKTATGKSSDVLAAEGVTWAADNGAKVISMSWGFYRRSRILEDALQYAIDKDVVLVASAGNYHIQNHPERRPHLPSTHPGVIEVAAVDADRKQAKFSNFGRTVTVAAPGVKVLSSIPGGYEAKSGTSMAAPHVAGVAALIRSHFPELNQGEVKARLEASAADLGDPGYDEIFGHGLVDAAAALRPSTITPALR
ncbi:MAG: S8 family serine peptidase [Candidatus Sericytochromatia bacterium]|uniref:S8 family serine peptidase n=1 Tax=Candidatus Tanganyikabacteria bacterium TaxID=2961651 RepID=A0A937X0B9_9BACT|nr:S8 family serine peptidase [Candidatus Tanganyikabacteria bacterium]